MRVDGARVPGRVLGLAILLAAVAPASAQIPDEFMNLKVLPKDIGKRELLGAMREYAGALGVRCSHCHLAKTPDSLEGTDFASDELETKRVARVMMQMTRDINERLLPGTGRASRLEVRCVTCHRGVARPETLEGLLMATVTKDGVPAAIDRYRELRGKYYGQGSYDFSAASLNALAERVARERNDLPAAVEIQKFNVEQNPNNAEAHILLGQLQAAKGDKAAAIASLTRGLELDPANERAKRLLESLRSPE